MVFFFLFYLVLKNRNLACVRMAGLSLLVFPLRLGSSC